MVIQEDCPVYTPGETYESVLFQAALAAKWKEPPRDALDTMVLKTSGQDLTKCDQYEQLDFVPFDPRTKRTEGKLKGPDGNIFRITKGAPHVVMEMCHNKEELRQKVEDKVHELGTRGVRSLALARMDNEDGVWKMLGILTFLDPPRPDTKDTIEKCAFYGVHVKMPAAAVPRRSRGCKPLFRSSRGAAANCGPCCVPFELRNVGTGARDNPARGWTQ
jgi:H+-transporting ATPase